MLVASVALPGIPLPGLFLVRPEEILVLALLPALLRRPGKRLTWVDLCFVLVGISAFISMAWGTLILGGLLSPRDLMEFVKIIKAWVLFRLALRPWSDKELGGMAKVFLVSVSASAFIGIIEWHNWLGLTEVLQSIYATGTGNVGTWRIIGTVGNPNYYGLLMALGLVVAVNMWNYNQRRAWRRLAVIATGLCGMALFLTNSRSSILAAVLAISLSFLLHVPQLRNKATWRALKRVRWQVIVITVLMVGAAVWTWSQYQVIGTLTSPTELALYRQNPIRRALYRLSEVERGFDTRIELMWKLNLPLIAESPVFGWGPGKAEHRTVTDNGYLLTLRRYGFIGLLCFLLLYWQASHVLYKALHINPRHSVRGRLAMTVLTIIVGYLGANLFVEVFYHLQLMSWLWLLIGIAASSTFYPFSSAAPNPSYSNKTVNR